MPVHGSRTLPTFCDNALMHNGFAQQHIALDLALQCDLIVELLGTAHNRALPKRIGL